MVSVLFVLGDGAWRIFVLCLSKGGIYPGLHVRREIEAVEAQRLGETLLLRQGSQLTGFAVCHIGAGTEAGSANCYVKFGAARPVSKLHAISTNCSRPANRSRRAASGKSEQELWIETYQHLIGGGFQTEMHGIACSERTTKDTHPGVYLLDDWR